MIGCDTPFEATTVYYDTYRALRATPAHVATFAEFRPLPSRARDVMIRFLRVLFGYNVCCFLGGSVVNYVAGSIPAFTGAVLYIAMDVQVPLQRFLLQRELTHTLLIGRDFQLHLLQIIWELDCFIYVLICESFSIPLAIYGIDHTAPVCDPRSNVDLVHYVWEYVELLPCRRYAMALVPSFDPTVSPHPRMFYLAHHRVESDGYTLRHNCRHCEITHRAAAQSFFSCRAPEACSCTMCCRRPPSLRAAATRVVYTLTFNLERFVLSVDTTYNEYVYAANSGQVNAMSLLPPTYPDVVVCFYYHRTTPLLWMHRRCPGAGPWNCAHRRTYTDMAQALEELISDRDRFWCGFCHKPLFFPPRCDVHYPPTPD